MLPQNDAIMAPPKKNQASKAKPATTGKRVRKYIEVRPVFIPGVEQVEKELGEDSTGAVNFLIREGLVKRGLWPEPGKQ
jgi:hypothetical protein